MARFISKDPNGIQPEGDISQTCSIGFTGGDNNMIAANATYASIEDLAFAHWQYKANEKLYAAKLITQNMYEFAKQELLKAIDTLERVCYNKEDNIKIGEGNGFIENTSAT